MYSSKIEFELKKVINFIMKTIFFLSFIMMGNVYAHSRNCFSKIGILVPMKIESTYFKTQIQNKKDFVINGVYFTEGEIAGHQIIFKNSGVGKINAAIATTDFINKIHPDIILMSGSAGNLNKKIHPKDVVIGSQVINADLGHLTAKGPKIPKSAINNFYFHRKIPWNLKLDSNLKKLLDSMKFSSQSLKKVYFGRIATTDIDPNPSSQAKLLRAFGVDLVEMEGAAFMQSCYLYNIPCVDIRCASDFIFPNTKAINQEAGTSASKVLIEIIQQLPKCRH